MVEVKESYDEIFNIEVEGLCFSLTNYPGEISSDLVFLILRELAPSIKVAIECNVILDVLDISTRISRAAKYLIDERDIAFELIELLPNPRGMDEDAQFVLAQVIDGVDQAYGGVLDLLQAKWSKSKKRTNPHSSPIDGPVILDTLARKDVAAATRLASDLLNHQDKQLARPDVQEKMMENII